MADTSDNRPTALRLMDTVQRGGRLWCGDRGVDRTTAAKAAFVRELPACGGDRGLAAMRALDVALSERGRRR